MAEAAQSVLTETRLVCVEVELLLTSSLRSEQAMVDSKIKSYILEAKRFIPHAGMGKDMHDVLDDVLHERSEDVVADIARVSNACKPLTWEWAKSAVDVLERAHTIAASSETDTDRD